MESIRQSEENKRAKENKTFASNEYISYLDKKVL